MIIYHNIAELITMESAHQKDGRKLNQQTTT